MSIQSFQKKRKLKQKKIAIYAIKEVTGSFGPVTFETHHERHKNKFLHAQSGLFTMTHGDIYYLENNKWPSIEDLYTKHGNIFFEIRKYTIRSECVAPLLGGLRKQGIALSTLMPSYSHVAEQVRNIY